MSYYALTVTIYHFSNKLDMHDSFYPYCSQLILNRMALRLLKFSSWQFCIKKETHCMILHPVSYPKSFLIYSARDQSSNNISHNKPLALRNHSAGRSLKDHFGTATTSSLLALRPNAINCISNLIWTRSKMEIT